MTRSLVTVVAVVGALLVGWLYLRPPSAPEDRLSVAPPTMGVHLHPVGTNVWCDDSAPCTFVCPKGECVVPRIEMWNDGHIVKEDPIERVLLTGDWLIARVVWPRPVDLRDGVEIGEGIDVVGRDGGIP